MRYVVTRCYDCGVEIDPNIYGTEDVIEVSYNIWVFDTKEEALTKYLSIFDELIEDVRQRVVALEEGKEFDFNYYTKNPVVIRTAEQIRWAMD